MFGQVSPGHHWNGLFLDPTGQSAQRFCIKLFCESSALGCGLSSAPCPRWLFQMAEGGTAEVRPQSCAVTQVGNGLFKPKGKQACMADTPSPSFHQLSMLTEGDHSFHTALGTLHTHGYAWKICYTKKGEKLVKFLILNDNKHFVSMPENAQISIPLLLCRI